MWTQEEAIKLCRAIERIAPEFGCHVALTGGCLYKFGHRKDLDILLYRIRQVNQIDWQGLWLALDDMGIKLQSDHGWCKKAVFNGNGIDFFDPEADAGEYPVEQQTQDSAVFPHDIAAQQNREKGQ